MLSCGGYLQAVIKALNSAKISGFLSHKYTQSADVHVTDAEIAGYQVIVN